MRRVNVTGDTDLDGLLHGRAAIRERRLHRRFGGQRQPGDQREPAAVLRAGHRDRRLVATAYGTRSSPATSEPRRSPSPTPAVHDAGRPRRRRAARSPTCTSDGGGLQGVRAGAEHELGRHHVGERRRRPAARSRWRTSTSRSPSDSIATIDSALAQGQEPAAHSGRLRRRPPASR